ncbi:MAG: O-methyltransferase [Thermoguttaceae bacterium]
MNSLLLPEVQNVLERLHALADDRDDVIIQDVRGNQAVWNASSSAQKAAMMQDALLSVSKDAGRFLYAVARSISARHIVEFGTSFGVSTIYFAAALKDNSGGLVIGSELENSKVAKAKQHLEEAGLSQFAEIRAGDALETLRDTGTLDLLFLDGWKLMYLDVPKVIMPQLRQGAVVLADDVTLFPQDVESYSVFVRDPANGLVTATLPLGDGTEYSVKLSPKKWRFCLRRQLWPAFSSA